MDNLNLLAFGEGIEAGYRDQELIECPYETELAQKSFWLGVRAAQFEGTNAEFWEEEARRVI